MSLNYTTHYNKASDTIDTVTMVTKIGEMMQKIIEDGSQVGSSGFDYEKMMIDYNGEKILKSLRYDLAHSIEELIKIIGPVQSIHQSWFTTIGNTEQSREDTKILFNGVYKLLLELNDAFVEKQECARIIQNVQNSGNALLIEPPELDDDLREAFKEDIALLAKKRENLEKIILQFREDPSLFEQMKQEEKKFHEFYNEIRLQLKGLNKKSFFEASQIEKELHSEYKKLWQLRQQKEIALIETMGKKLGEKVSRLGEYEEKLKSDSPRKIQDGNIFNKEFQEFGAVAKSILEEAPENISVENISGFQKLWLLIRNGAKIVHSVSKDYNNKETEKMAPL